VGERDLTRLGLQRRGAVEEEFVEAWRPPLMRENDIKKMAYSIAQFYGLVSVSTTS
jgi:hypothetical protein